MKRTIAVLGGDARQARLAGLLLADGHETVTWGLEQGGAPNGVPLDRAVQAELVVLPLPVCRAGELNLPLTDTSLPPERLWARLRPEQLLLGGMTERLAPRLARDFGLTLLDYYAREEVQVANAVPTAEGAIALALEASARTIWDSRCLVLGAGRTGRVLAWRLQALGAQVAVAARKQEDLTWARVWGCEPLRTDALEGALGCFDFIFNTIPALVLDAKRLAEVPPGCILMELASAPGGIDGGAAKALGRQLIAAPGLPGKAAPLTAAMAIRDSIYHILEERGEPL